MLFGSYQVEEGLSHSIVWAVVEDSRGYMWFGTNDGLNRFDGSKFKVFRRRNDDEKIIGNNLIISDEISDFYRFCKKKELILPNFCILRKDSGIQYF